MSAANAVRNYKALANVERAFRSLKTADLNVRPMRKFKRFKDHKTRTGSFFERLSKGRADPFAHWQLGMTSVFS